MRRTTWWVLAMTLGLGCGSTGKGGPQGPQGEAGPAGPAGATGPAGPAGGNGGGGQGYLRTIVVSPVPGDADASGKALFAALAGIADAAPTNRYLVRLEPGDYTVAFAQPSPKLPDYVDLEGAGEIATVLVGNPRSYLSLGQGELRFIGFRGVGLICEGKSASLFRLAFSGEGGAIDTGVCPLRLDSITVDVVSGPGPGVEPLTAVNVSNSTLHDVQIQAHCTLDNLYCEGLRGENLVVRDSSIVVKNVGKAGCEGAMLWNATLDDVQIEVNGGTSGADWTSGLDVLSRGNDPDNVVTVRSSSIVSNQTAVYTWVGSGHAVTLSLADSELQGAIHGIGTASPTLRCFGLYDASLAPVSCP